MSFKDQLEAVKNEALDRDTIVGQVKETLLAAARMGESSTLISLSNERDSKTNIICHFLESEDIKFENVYDAKQIQRQNYYDRNKDKIIPNYTDTKYIFQGIRVFLQKIIKKTKPAEICGLFYF